MMQAERKETLPRMEKVKCVCGSLIFDGEVIKSRVVNLAYGTAKCKLCKAMVPVPVAYKPLNS